MITFLLSIVNLQLNFLAELKLRNFKHCAAFSLFSVKFKQLFFQPSTPTPPVDAASLAYSTAESTFTPSPLQMTAQFCAFRPFVLTVELQLRLIRRRLDSHFCRTRKFFPLHNFVESAQVYSPVGLLIFEQSPRSGYWQKKIEGTFQHLHPVLSTSYTCRTVSMPQCPLCY